MPKISVIIPVYNVEKYLRECLNSILAQTLSDIEIICVDDGSTDNSLDILREYESKDNRVKIIQQKNQYAGVARNNGMKIATGEYLHFMDSDDYLYDKSVYEKMLQIVEQNNFPNILRFCAQAFDCKSNSYIQNKYYEQTSVESSKMNSCLNIEDDLSSILKLSVAPWQGLIKRDFVNESLLEFNSNKCSNDLSFFILSVLTAKNIYLSDLKIVTHRVNNSESLIGVREKNFECMFVSIGIISEFLNKSNFSKQVKTQVLLHSIGDLFGFYDKYIYNSRYSFKIHKQTAEFIKSFDIEELKPEIEKITHYKKIKKMKQFNNIVLIFDYCLGKILLILKNISRNIFSITNLKNDSGEKEKMIVLAGIKLKFKKDKNAKS